MALGLAKDDYSGWNNAFMKIGFGIFPDWEDLSNDQKNQKIFELNVQLEKNRKKYQRIYDIGITGITGIY